MIRELLTTFAQGAALAFIAWVMVAGAFVL
jgi:hypothetical protein